MYLDTIQIHKNVSRYSILYLPDTFWTPLDKLASKMANWTVTFNMEMSYFLFLVSAKAMARESELLRDLLEVCEQRDQLQSMLAKDKARYQKEDAQVEAQMQAKILTVTQ